MQRPVREGTFRTHDGVDLFYRHWPATEGPARGALVLFHRGHEHSGRMAHLPDELSLPEFDCFAWDQRGHGRSPGPRGDAPSFMTLVRDVQSFVDHLREAHGFAPEDLAVVAQSVGAVLVATWVHDYAPRLRCMVLASPAFDVKLYVPLARPGLALMQKIRGNFFVTSYVKSKFLTHDPERIASYDRDPLIARAISVRILLGLYDAAGRVVGDAQAITVPTQLLVSGADWVVKHKPQHAFFDRLGTAVKERHVLAGFLHDTLGEAGRGRALAKVRSFVLRRFAQPCAVPALLDADEGSFTREEADALAAPLPAWSPRGLYWAATRASLRLGGLLSDGVRLGHETGFDSGATLDYVYRNTPAGRTSLGRMIDRTYLDSIGWRGIRVRKRHVEELLALAIAQQKAAGGPVHVVDVAAGHGRYVLDALAHGPMPDSILLRDYDPRNVEQGRALIAARGLRAVARFEQGDAFATADLAALAPRPTIAVVSGLFELFPENAAPRACLSGLAGAMQEDGLLVYTGQPWHPQLELIARALTSHRGGEAWVMRRRTQAELDALVRAAGFTKVAQRVDERGIFTVSLARRTGPAR
ncbi:MAG: bifunctional alpha/beta hydrolase/class I SAM-dependent methyltransferase [Burkholderiales bacterium]